VGRVNTLADIVRKIVWVLLGAFACAILALAGGIIYIIRSSEARQVQDWIPLPGLTLLLGTREYGFEMMDTRVEGVSDLAWTEEYIVVKASKPLPYAIFDFENRVIYTCKDMQSAQDKYTSLTQGAVLPELHPVLEAQKIREKELDWRLSCRNLQVYCNSITGLRLLAAEIEHYRWREGTLPKSLEQVRERAKANYQNMDSVIWKFKNSVGKPYIYKVNDSRTDYDLYIHSPVRSSVIRLPDCLKKNEFDLFDMENDEKK